MHRINRSKKLKPGYREISLVLVFQALQRVSPYIASLMAYLLWFHPGRRATHVLPAFTPAGTHSMNIKVNNKEVCVCSAGSGPSVLLVHGWGSSGRQMANIGRQLLQQGYRITWFDAPAHGESSGWQSNLYEISETLLAIQQQQGDFYAVVAHSFGVPCSFYAIRHGLNTEKVVAIASPATISGMIDKFCSMIRANQATHDHLTKRISRFVREADITHIDTAFMAQTIELPCLLIHDKHDRMVKFDDARIIQQNLQHSHLIQTEHLGHNRILQDDNTIKLCIDFIRDTENMKKAS